MDLHRPEGERYTHSYRPHVIASHAERTAEEAAYFLLPHLAPGQRVLDFGCGPGSITVGLAEAVAPGEVVGIDISEEVLAHARDRVAAAGLGNVTLTCASAYEIPYPDGTFDAAFGHQVLQHLADPVAALREVRRVLRPGGLVGVRDADYGTMTHAPHEPLLDRWLDLYHRVAHGNGGEPDAGRRLPGWLLEAGFELVHVGSSTWTYADPAERRNWADLWSARYREPEFTGVAEERGLSDTGELEAIAVGWRRWAEQPDGFFAFIHGEAIGHRS